MSSLEPPLTGLEPGSQGEGSGPVGPWAGWSATIRAEGGALGWALLFVALFFATHWQEISSPTWNVDDWALVTDPILQAHQSRPGWDLLYGLLFQHSFSPFFNWLIAAGSLYALAAVVGFFFPWFSAPWRTLLALLISGHAYLLDLFNFSFCLGLYLLPAPLSLLAALLMGYGPRVLLGRAWLDWGAGVGLVMLAMAIYQPTGYVGLGLIGLELLARALEGRRFRAWAGLRVLVGTLLGCGLYYGWALLAMALAGAAANERTGFASLGLMLNHLFSIEHYREIYNTNLPLLSTAPQFLLGCLFLLVLLIASGYLLRLQPSQLLPGQPLRSRRLAQLWLAAALLTSLPLWLSFVLRSGFPSRAFCLANLGIAWFTVVVLAWWQRPRTTRWERGLSRLLVAALVVGYIVPQAAFASRVWDRVQLLERRDMALAQLIAADVQALTRSQAQGGDGFRLFGTTERNQSFPHWSSVGESAFRQSWSIVAIFRQLLGLNVEHIAYRQSADEQAVRSQLPACRSYPQPQSIVWHQGAWLVCLEANPSAPLRR